MARITNTLATEIPNAAMAATLAMFVKAATPFEVPPVIKPPNQPLANTDEVWSNHPGGANVLFCDGSVKFVSQMINQLTWSYMATRATGDVLGDAEF